MYVIADNCNIKLIFRGSKEPTLIPNGFQNWNFNGIGLLLAKYDQIMLL